jgi:hypothetical protein
MILMLNCLLKLAETQSLNSSFLVFWVADSTLNIFDTQFCHFLLLSTATGTLTALWAVTSLATITTITTITATGSCPVLASLFLTSSTYSGGLFNGSSGSGGELLSAFLAQQLSDRFASALSLSIWGTQFT